jgi:hypothetical protein
LEIIAWLYDVASFASTLDTSSIITYLSLSYYGAGQGSSNVFSNPWAVQYMTTPDFNGKQHKQIVALEKLCVFV